MISVITVFRHWVRWLWNAATLDNVLVLGVLALLLGTAKVLVPTLILPYQPVLVHLAQMLVVFVGGYTTFSVARTVVDHRFDLQRPIEISWLSVKGWFVRWLYTVGFTFAKTCKGLLIAIPVVAMSWYVGYLFLAPETTKLILIGLAACIALILVYLVVLATPASAEFSYEELSMARLNLRVQEAQRSLGMGGLIMALLIMFPPYVLPFIDVSGSLVQQGAVEVCKFLAFWISTAWITYVYCWARAHSVERSL